VSGNGLEHDPRSLASGGDKWITDTRIYNLIWMGRWLERSENICRALDSAASASMGKSNDLFGASLTGMSSAWGLPAGDPAKTLDDLVWRSPSSSILTCLYRARENASQIAPLELIQAINSTIHNLEQRKAEVGALTPDSLHALVTQVLADLKAAFGIVEQAWFRREALGEEEIMRRFVQQ
jgi:uncharacterized alpha-E superfamily protein